MSLAHHNLTATNGARSAPARDRTGSSVEPRCARETPREATRDPSSLGCAPTVAWRIGVARVFRGERRPRLMRPLTASRGSRVSRGLAQGATWSRKGSQRGVRSTTRTRSVPWSRLVPRGLGQSRGVSVGLAGSRSVSRGLVQGACKVAQGAATRRAQHHENARASHGRHCMSVECYTGRVVAVWSAGVRVRA